MIESSTATASSFKGLFNASGNLSRKASIADMPSFGSPNINPRVGNSLIRFGTIAILPPAVILSSANLVKMDCKALMVEGAAQYPASSPSNSFKSSDKSKIV